MIGFSGSIVLKMKMPGQGERVTTCPFTVSSISGPVWVPLAPDTSLGVHIYLLNYTSEACEFAVRVSNGIVNRDGSGFFGRAWVQALTMVVDLPAASNWVCSTLPAPSFRAFIAPDKRKAIVELVHSDNGAQVCIDARGMYTRRFAIGSSESACEDTLLMAGVVRTGSPRLKPAHIPPPSVPLAGVAGMDERVRTASLCTSRLLRTGLSGPGLGHSIYTPASVGALDEFMDSYEPGFAGGGGIEFLPGWDRMPGYRRVLHDVAMSRQCVAAFDRETGQPITSWTQKYEYHLSRGWSKLTQLPWACAPHDDPWSDARAPKDLNSDGSVSQQILPVDGQHLIRAYRHGLGVLSWRHDQSVVDDLNMLMWDCRYSWTDDPAPTTKYWDPFSLVQVEKRIRKAKGIGDPMLNREYGWVLLLGSVMFEYFPSQHAEWCRRMGGLAIDAQMINGFFCRYSYGSYFGSPDPWNDWKIPREARVAQGIEHGIVAYAVACTANTLPWRQLRAAAAASIFGPIAPRPVRRRVAGGRFVRESLGGPLLDRWNIVSKASRSGIENPLKVAVAGTLEVENFNIWAPLAVMAASASGPERQRYLSAMLLYPVPGRGFVMTSAELLENLANSPYSTHVSAAHAALTLEKAP